MSDGINLMVGTAVAGGLSTFSSFAYGTVAEKRVIDECGELGGEGMGHFPRRWLWLAHGRTSHIINE